MQVIAIASEIHPLIKTGGLADVVGALPGYLRSAGISLRTLLPGYPSIINSLKSSKRLLATDALIGTKSAILSTRVRDLDLLLLDAPALFAREGGPYGDAAGRDWPDNWRRFSALGKVGAAIAGGALKGWRPDLLHAHDWQGAMAAAYVRFGPAPRVPSVVTIHNMAFQGRFPVEIFPQLGLPPEALGIDGVEYYGGVGFLKAGLVSADAITTVSPSYAREIRTPGEGMGLDGLIEGRADRVHGILNGIDAGEWNPATDPLLAQGFDARSLTKRAGNRRAVEQAFGLEADGGPLFIIVSRLTWQKGMDHMAGAIDHLVAAGGRLAVLGTGDAALEAAFTAAAARHPGRVGVRIGYDEAMSHLMQGGGDAILIPSRFEPCGLTQLYGLRYGCVPVVARVGGLADTVIDANEAALAAGVATGVHFAPADPGALADAISRAVALYADRPAWKAMQRAGMKADFSWDRSAARYAALFRSLVG
jgi:starch synthase